LNDLERKLCGGGNVLEDYLIELEKEVKNKIGGEKDLPRNFMESCDIFCSFVYSLGLSFNLFSWKYSLCNRPYSFWRIGWLREIISKSQKLINGTKTMFL